MIYVLTFGRADLRILGVFTSQQEADSAKDRIVQSQIHPQHSLFVDEYRENELTVDADMLA